MMPKNECDPTSKAEEKQAEESTDNLVPLPTNAEQPAPSKYQWLCLPGESPNLETPLIIPLEISILSKVFGQTDDAIFKKMGIANIQGCIQYMDIHCQQLLPARNTKQYLKEVALSLYDQHNRGSLTGYSKIFIDQLEAFGYLYHRLYGCIYYGLNDEDFMLLTSIYTGANELTLTDINSMDMQEVEERRRSIVANLTVFLEAEKEDVKSMLRVVCLDCLCQYAKEFLTSGHKYISSSQLFSEYANRTAEMELYSVQ